MHGGGGGGCLAACGGGGGGEGGGSDGHLAACGICVVVAKPDEQEISPAHERHLPDADVPVAAAATLGESGGEDHLEASEKTCEADGEAEEEESREEDPASLREGSTAALPDHTGVAPRQRSEEHLSTPLWLVAVVLPVIAVCLPWALLTDLGCSGPDSRNIEWFTWAWDMVYVFIGVLTGLGVIDTCYLNPSVSNWNNTFRLRIYSVAIAAGMAACVLQKVVLLEFRLFELDVAWLLVRMVVIVAATVVFATVLVCVLWFTRGREEKLFALINWFLCFVLAVWALLFFIANQIFVKAYMHVHTIFEEDNRSIHIVGIYDYCTAIFFSAFWIPCWGAAGHLIISRIKNAAPPVLKDRVHILIVLWVELFNTAFGRIVFKEVQVEAVLLTLVLKDSVMRVLDLALKYMPRRMVRLAMQAEDDDSSVRFKVCSQAFALCLDIDLRLALEWCCGRGLHYDSHHLPDNAFSAEEVAKAASVHRHHISRQHWREYGHEASFDTSGEQGSDRSLDSLHWSSAMLRSAHVSQTMAKQLHRSPTHLEPGMRSIERARDTRDKQGGEEEEDEGPCTSCSGLSASLNLSERVSATVSDRVHGLRSCWGLFGRLGVSRLEVKAYLKSVWGLSEWGQSDDLEAEALCDRICFVQRNLRLKFVAVCLPRIATSIIGVSFMYLRAHFRCTCAALDMDREATGEEQRLWLLLFAGDIFEIAIISFVHRGQRLEQKNRSSWHWVRHVLWEPAFTLSVIALTMHIVQDSYLAFYVAIFRGS